MKKVALSFLFFWGIGFVFARSFPGLSSYLEKSELVPQEKTAVSRFTPSPYPIQRRSFAIVVIARNNGAFIEKTLKSIFSQTYEKMRLIYIDDASDDGSFELARDLIYDNGVAAETNLVKNEERLGTAANLFRAVQSCLNDEIVVVLNGEDRLAHEWVLERLNQYYADSDLWLTFGQYMEYPSFQVGQCFHFLESSRGFREIPSGPFHLKSFYAGLFKKLREEDLIYQGKFMPASGELAYMIPLLEMAKDHFQFIPEILYLCTTSPKEDRELQARCEKHVRSLAAYAPLQRLFPKSNAEMAIEGILP